MRAGILIDVDLATTLDLVHEASVRTARELPLPLVLTKDDDKKLLRVQKDETKLLAHAVC